MSHWIQCSFYTQASVFSWLGSCLSGYQVAEPELRNLIPHCAFLDKKQPLWPWTRCTAPGHPWEEGNLPNNLRENLRKSNHKSEENVLAYNDWGGYKAIAFLKCCYWRRRGCCSVNPSPQSTESRVRAAPADGYPLDIGLLVRLTWAKVEPKPILCAGVENTARSLAR